MLEVPYPNTFWVVSHKFLAGEHPCHGNEDVDSERLTGLLLAGTRTFIDLTEEDEVPSYHGLLRHLAEGRRLHANYVRIPIPDGDVPAMRTVKFILDVIDRSLEDSSGVFVHCLAGRGRTGVVVGCFLRRHALATPAEVIVKISDLRKGMPTARETCPNAPEQAALVERWHTGA